MNRMFQINDQVLLVVGKTAGRGIPPHVITSVCVDSEPHYVRLFPRPDDVRIDIGNGGVRNLFNYYQGLRPPSPKGTVVIQARPSETTFDNLHEFATDVAAFKPHIEAALQAVARERCPDRARVLSFTIDGEQEGRITVHRLYCVVRIDLYVAVHLRGLMAGADDYEDFIDSVMAEMRQTGKTYVSQEAGIRRGGRIRRDFPIVRRKGLNQLIAYIKVGIGDFVFQSGWDVADHRERCPRRAGGRTDAAGKFLPRFEEIPRHEGEDEKTGKPDFGESDEKTPPRQPKPEPEPAPTEHSPVDHIRGIGKIYAARLAKEDIFFVEEIADLDVEQLAEILRVPIDKARIILDNAKKGIWDK